MPELVERAGKVEVLSPMRPGMRVLLGFLGGKVLESGSSWVRADVEAIVGRLGEFVGVP